MSYGHSLPSSFAGFGMPSSMGSETFTQMMNPDSTDSLFPLDDIPFYFSLGGSMSMSLDPTEPLPQSFTPTPAPAPAPGQASSTALAGNTEQPGFSPDDDASNAPRENVFPGGSSNANTLTEFTKRRNWPARVVEELQDLLLILDANGRIKHASPSAVPLTGHDPSDVHDLFMRDLLHPDDVGVFTSELNESIASGTPLRIFYRLKKKDGAYAVFESIGHAHIAAARFAPNPSNQTPFCQAVFMMARPYPTKNAALLDSFLEHKMENERLKRKIAELQREEQDETEESERTWLQSQETSPSESGMRMGSNPFQTMADAGIPPRERRTSLDGGPAESVASTRRPSIGASHADTIEMLTGLRYQEGERSRGITTGNPSPALITGDAGIAFPIDRDQRAGDKKKKLKLAEEYVCTDCGTLESPEWRKGPKGPKTLCNACGLRWAKREKKKSSAGHGGAGESDYHASGPGADANA